MTPQAYPSPNCIFSSSGSTSSYAIVLDAASLPSLPSSDDILEVRSAKSRSRFSRRVETAGVKLDGSMEENLGRPAWSRSGLSVLVGVAVDDIGSEEEEENVDVDVDADTGTRARRTDHIM